MHVDAEGTFEYQDFSTPLWQYRQSRPICSTWIAWEKATGWIAFVVPTDAKLKTITYRIGLISTIALTADLPKP